MTLLHGTTACQRSIRTAVDVEKHSLKGIRGVSMWLISLPHYIPGLVSHGNIYIHPRSMAPLGTCFLAGLFVQQSYIPLGVLLTPVPPDISQCLSKKVIIQYYPLI